LLLRTLVTIWVAASELSSPGTQAVAHTAREALGPEVEIRVEASPATAQSAEGVEGEGEPGVPPDTGREPAKERAAVRAGSIPPGSGAVELTWYAGTSEAHLRCYVPTTQRWIERSVTFDDDDPEAERGRTLGFVVASIFVEAPPKPDPPKPKPEPKRQVPPRAEPEPPRVGAAAAVSAVGPGDGTSFGVNVVFDYRALPRLRLGIVGEGRFGTMASVQATLRYLAAGATVTWEAFRPKRNTWLGASVGVSGAELRLTHLTSEDPEPDALSHVVLVVHPMVSGGLSLGGAAAAFVEAGVEVHSGQTTVVVGEDQAEIGRITPAARLGLRTDF